MRPGPQVAFGHQTLTALDTSLGQQFSHGHRLELGGMRLVERQNLKSTVPLLGIVSLGYAPDAITAAAATICYRAR